MRGVEHAPEELAKDWLVRMIERTPLDELERLPLAWIAREAPGLIAEILHGLSDPLAPPELDRAAEGHTRADQLARLRTEVSAPAEVPRDIASLQAVIVAALRDQVRERDPSELGRWVERLAEIFGEIQAQVTETLVRQRAGEPRPDPLTGLPGGAELHEWLVALLAGHRRDGHPFSLLAIDIEGLKRINDAYGRQAGDRMLVAVADVIRGEVSTVDRAFRITDGEFCVLVPSQRADEARRLAERLRRVIDRYQTEAGPRVSISVGVASCPEHGDDEAGLMGAAEEATYRAKAAGDGVAVGVPGRDDSPQDR
jgi:diguanylate cyclase (GGDEF)-like protein